MARRRSAASKRMEQRVKESLTVGAVGVVLLVAFWRAIWPYFVTGLVLGGTAFAGRWLWRRHRMLAGRARRRREQEDLEAGHRTLVEVDAMSGGDFEDLVVALCRRDGCTEVRRVGGSHDDGADVLGRLPDGRSMVIQCKRYSPRSRIASREVRELLGTRVHFQVDVAIFVTSTYFTGPSERFAVQNGVIAIHRDHFGLWNKGTPLLSFSEVNGAGQGDQRHRGRWRATYE